MSDEEGTVHPTSTHCGCGYVSPSRPQAYFGAPEEKVTRVNNLWRFPQEQEHDVYDDLPYPEPLDETIQRFADTAADSEFALKNFENALKGLSFENDDDDGIGVMEQLVDLSRQSINNVRLINEKVQSIQRKHP